VNTTRCILTSLLIFAALSFGASFWPSSHARLLPPRKSCYLQSTGRRVSQDTSESVSTYIFTQYRYPLF
jgi:hypothetical protein